MTLISRALLLSATLLAVTLADAIAQTNNPAGNYGSNNSTTASPGTADNKPASGMGTGDVHSRGAAGNYSGSAMNSGTSGGTGRSMVPGSNSSQSAAAAGTATRQTGASDNGGGK